MCGIVGVVGEIDYELTKAFTMMLQFDVVRGKDSTGIVCVDKDGNVSSAKETWLPTDFIQHREVEDILKSTGKRVLIGHNRHATVGKVNKAGAHPFEFDNVIGVHNGTTPKYKFKDAEKFNVDSEALYNHIDKEGIESMWGNMSGAASLAFYHKLTRRFHLLRNDERPMFVAFTKDNKSMLFASEPWMIQAVVYRTKIEIDEQAGIRSTVINQLYSFDVLTAGSLSKFSTRKVQPFKNTYTVAKKEAKPILNTWAQQLYDLKVGNEVQFEITSFYREKTSNLVRFNIESTSTRAVLLGRVFIDEEREPETVKDAIESIGTADTWRGRVVSCSYSGAVTGFTVGTFSIYNEDELKRLRANTEVDTDDTDIVDGLIIDNEDGIISREQFDKQDGVHNTCSYCNDPVSYDHPETFKFVGIHEGKKGFICESCEDDFAELNSASLITSKTVRNIKDYID
jgi:predicted glutamine amidotransferase